MTDGGSLPSAEEARAQLRLAQGQQRLDQFQTIFNRRMERERQLSRIQAAYAWTILAMLPGVAITCVVIFFKYETLPTTVVTAASGAFFVDVVAAVLAGYKAWLPAKPPEDILTAITPDPFQEDVTSLPGPGAAAP